MTTTSQSNEALDERAIARRRATRAAFVGTAIEWYDFFIFGTAAALVFGRVFFPEVDPAAALLASFATLWVGFLARPLGAAICGYLGDRHGRRNVLVGTLILMGSASAAIGMLPTYAQIGVAAPILLVILRLLQGVAIGGEWGGAVVIATEHAEAGRKSRAGAWVQQGNPVGAILAALAFLLVGQLPEEAFISWGWRIPFLLSILLVVVGLVIRLRVQESEEFTEMRASDAISRNPVSEVFATAPGTLVLAIIASITGISTAYFLNTFVLSWTTTSFGIDRQLVLNVLLITYVVQFCWQPIAARLAERFGNAPVMIAGLVFTVIAAVPYFLAIVSGNIVLIGICQAIIMIGVSSYYAMLASFLSSAFSPRMRYTGVSLAYQLCSTLIGGSTPLLAQAVLTGSGGSAWAVAAFFMGTLAATAIGVASLSRVIRRRELQEAAA